MYIHMYIHIYHSMSTRRVLLYIPDNLFAVQVKSFNGYKY